MTLQNRMDIYGIGEIIVVPDLFLITAEVKTFAKTAEETKNDNEEIMGRLLDELGHLGYRQKDFQTISYQLYPVYQHIDGEERLQGYELRHEFVIQSNDFSQLGTLIDSLTKYGVTRIVNVDFSQVNHDEFYQTALQLAVTESQQKAKNIAEALNVRVDLIPKSITELKEDEQGSSRLMPNELLDGSSIIQRGEMKVRAIIKAVFQFV